ncbi:MAG: hypothetical protein JNM62_10550 [Flavobacteriales bacterium]|nr:hypothetical protein [Flavobacteriales bacterium]
MNESLDHRDRCSLRSMALRLFTALMCGWLFMVPQVMYSGAVVDLCEEYGTNTPPLIEEEEVHQTGVPPRSLLASGHAPCDLDEVELPHWEELLLHTLHGEVPHPPPWA